MSTEETHTAFGRNPDQLDVVVVDDAKPVQSIIRSILHGMKVARVRTYDTAQAAMDAMVVDAPNLIIVDWIMDPIDGISMLKALRSKRMGALATVPAIVVTGAPTRRLVEASLLVGAHAVIAKPMSPQTLQRRIEAICHDARLFYLDETTDRWMLRGTQAKLAAQRKRQTQYDQVRTNYLEYATRKTQEAERLLANLPVIDTKTAATTPAPVAEPGNFGKLAAAGRGGKAQRGPRKAIGIGGRRVDPKPAAPTTQT